MVDTRRVARTDRSGSVLVPVVAAMVILLLAGFALTELNGAQRLHSTIALDSVKAYWIAEAGIQHAAYTEAAISSPVTFNGGTYTVTKSSDSYTATGSWGGAKRLATENFAILPDGPLDVAASVATAAKASGKEFTLDLVSISSVDVVLASFSLSASASTTMAKKLKRDGHEVWKQDAGVALPTGILSMNQGSTGDRTVPVGSAKEFKYEAVANPSGTITYTLVLYFTDSSSSILVFAIVWT